MLLVFWTVCIILIFDNLQKLRFETTIVTVLSKANIFMLKYSSICVQSECQSGSGFNWSVLPQCTYIHIYIYIFYSKIESKWARRWNQEPICRLSEDSASCIINLEKFAWCHVTFAIKTHCNPWKRLLALRSIVECIIAQHAHIGYVVVRFVLYS